jgi:hypothetical protein
MTDHMRDIVEEWEGEHWGKHWSELMIVSREYGGHVGELDQGSLVGRGHVRVCECGCVKEKERACVHTWVRRACEREGGRDRE